jgi:methionine synthase II (cobalamin-independent)
MPGEDFRETTKMVLDELPDLAHLPELPARGAIAGMIGRTAAIVSDLGFDLQPAGWRLTDAAGMDHRRARSLLSQDLDVLEDESQGRTGLLKVQVVGPWTLAAMVEKPRGDKVLSDFGARRDLAQALAAGVADHLAEVQKRVPGVAMVLQVDEPMLPAVMRGQVRTASGFHRHRSVDAPIASEALEWVLEAAGSALSVVHCCAADPPVSLFRGAGADAVSLDLGVLAAASYDELATVLDEGGQAWLGVVPTGSAHAPTTNAALDRTRRLLDMLGYDPEEVADRIVLTPACGLAGATPGHALATLRALREAAHELAG